MGSPRFAHTRWVSLVLLILASPEAAAAGAGGTAGPGGTVAAAASSCCRRRGRTKKVLRWSWFYGLGLGVLARLIVINVCSFLLHQALTPR